MRWLDYDTQNCSIRRTLEVIGRRWSLLILREAFNGVRRFDQIRDHLEVSEATLSRRLQDLVSFGVLEAVPYRDPGQRARHEYRLTDKGADLYPVLMSLMTWGDQYVADEAGPPLEVTHRGCGQPARAEVRCAAGHLMESSSQGQTAPGPAARSIS